MASNYKMWCFLKYSKYYNNKCKNKKRVTTGNLLNLFLLEKKDYQVKINLLSSF